MRLFRVLPVIMFLAACGAPQPKPVASGPRLEASLAASWPVAAPARQAAFSRNGRFLATSDASGLIAVRETDHWKILQTFHHPGGATSVAFTPDGTHLYTGGYEGTVRDWNLNRRALAQTYNGPRGTVWTIAVSPDGKRLAAAGEDKLIRVWILRQSGAPMILRGHTLNIWDIQFSPDGKRLASGSFDYMVKLWEVEGGKLVKTLVGHQGAVVGLSYSPDGKILATGADDSTARFWRASDGAPLRTIDNGRHVDKVAISPDGRWLATGGHARGTIGTLWHELTGGGRDGEPVRIWRVSDGAMVAGLPHPDDVIYVAFSPDSRWLVTSGEDSRFRLWALRPR